MNTSAAQAAKQATATHPDRHDSVGDPVATGLVASLARPGGNITGFSLSARSAKREAAGAAQGGRSKRLARRGLCWIPQPWLSHHGRRDGSRRPTLGVQLLTAYRCESPGEFERAFATATRSRARRSSSFGDRDSSSTHRARSSTLALKHRLPIICGQSEYAEAGGLIAYGRSTSTCIAARPHYVDKILKGAKPGDLPVEQPTKFELVINLKTAKALGLTIPPSLLARADQVIE